MSRFFRTSAFIRSSRAFATPSRAASSFGAVAENETDQVGEMMRRRLLAGRVEIAGKLGAERGIALDHRAQGRLAPEHPRQLRLRRGCDLEQQAPRKPRRRKAARPGEIGGADDIHFGEAHLAALKLDRLACLRDLHRAARRKDQDKIVAAVIQKRAGAGEAGRAAARRRDGDRMQQRELIVAVDVVVVGRSDVEPAEAAANPFAPCLIGRPFRQPMMEDREPVGHLCLGHDPCSERPIDQG
ncbi:hypothetical protein JOH48_006047 [Bradyrhizobium elkanii]|nr:hypothetical protein [Bradyrhizobium elkanii]